MSEKKTELKREMGLFSSVCVLVGCVIGSGIFTTPGNIAASAGSSCDSQFSFFFITNLSQIFVKLS